jgi:hypothetical protein
MIETELHLTHKQREVAFDATVIHLQTSFGKSPEVLNPVNVGPSRTKAFAVTDTDMPKALQVQLIICTLAVRVDPRVLLHMRLDRSLQVGLVDSLREDHTNDNIALQQPEYRDFASGSTSSLAPCAHHRNRTRLPRSRRPAVPVPVHWPGRYARASAGIRSTFCS